MATEERPLQAKKAVREPLTANKRRRLEKTFEVAEKRAATAAALADFDHVTELLMQCATGDPSNAIYIRAYLENLQKKYGNNKKGSRLAQLQEWGSRSAVKKALAQEQWDEVIKHGLKVLTVNPWDLSALTAMATAAKKTGDRDCEFCYLKAALMGSPKDPTCKRLYAIALTDRGLIDQAIAVWRRVEEILPDDEEAKRTIAVLTVQKARARGEFDASDDVARKARVKAQQQEEKTLEQKLLQTIKQEPENLEAYLELSQIYLSDERYKEAEALIGQACQISDNAPEIREQWEDIQLRRLRQDITSAQDPEVKELQAKYYQRDVEVWQNRVERFPTNLSFRYELGYRYMLTKRYAEAIRELQAARADTRRRGACMLTLGQCFQHIKQYPLAMRHYEDAIQEIPDRDSDNKKRALYLAGRLAMSHHVNDLPVAERHLTALAGLDFTYRDVSALLDKIVKLRENPPSGGESNSGGPEDNQ